MLYLDTSVVVAYYIPEEKSGKVEKLLSRVDTAAVSALTEVEFNSAVSRRIRLKEISPEDGRRIISQFSLHLQEGRYTFSPLSQREYGLARDWLASFATNLRTLDALHLAIAFSQQLTLVTADADFGKAAQTYGVPVKII